MDDPAADIDVDDALVRTLLEQQHPSLADRPIVEVANGWDNVMFRVGDDLSVRMPRRRVAASLIEHEQRWLPVLAPTLPLPIPAPTHLGVASDAFPFAWSVLPWFDGESAFDAPPTDLMLAADDLGAFVHALHVPAPDDAPANPVRGVQLEQRAAAVKQRLFALAGVVPAAVTRVLWEELSATPAWDGPPVWLHGDLHPSNMLTTNGRLSAVIDFGDITAGDPATDMSIAWMLFDAPSRERFRQRIEVDAHTWRRAAGWALNLSLAYLAGSAAGSPMIPIGHATLAAVIGDFS